MRRVLTDLIASEDKLQREPKEALTAPTVTMTKDRKLIVYFVVVGVLAGIAVAVLQWLLRV